MDTRSVQFRLDHHEDCIKCLRADVREIKISMEKDRAILEKERGEEVEFRNIMLAWMKQQGTQPVFVMGTDFNSGGVVFGSGIISNSSTGDGVFGVNDQPPSHTTAMLPWAVSKVQSPEPQQRPASLGKLAESPQVVKLFDPYHQSEEVKLDTLTEQPKERTLSKLHVKFENPSRSTISSAPGLFAGSLEQHSGKGSTVFYNTWYAFGGRASPNSNNSSSLVNYMGNQFSFTPKLPLDLYVGNYWNEWRHQQTYSLLRIYSICLGFWGAHQLRDRGQYTTLYGVDYAVWGRKPLKPPECVHFFAFLCMLYDHEPTGPLKPPKPPDPCLGISWNLWTQVLRARLFRRRE